MPEPGALPAEPRLPAAPVESGLPAGQAESGASARSGVGPPAAGSPVRAAGAVVWRHGPAGPEVALIRRPRYGDWTFPKGKCEPGEHLLETAVRETGEETGLTVTLGRPLGQVRYQTGGARPKVVSYWAATPSTPAAQAFTPNEEVDALEWLPVPAALGRLTYAHDVTVLTRFRAGPDATVPLILVRHSTAGSKHDWPGDDMLRPLDAAGAVDAAALAGLLACYAAGPAILSSPALRCTATLAPYAALTGLAVHAEPAFAPRPPPGAAAAAVAAIARAGRPAVICGHRENLPVLLGVACGELGSPPPQGAQLHKGGFWVLHTAAGKLTAAERHDNTDRPGNMAQPGPGGTEAGSQSSVGGRTPSRVSSQRLASTPVPPL